MKYTIEKLEKRNGDIAYRHKQDSGSFVSYSSTPTLQKYDLQGFRLILRLENWRGSGNTVFQKVQKFSFDSKGAKKPTQPAIVYRTRGHWNDPWADLSDDSTFPITDPFLTKEVYEDDFSTKKLSGVTSSNKPCIKTEDVPEEYNGKTSKITPKTTVFEGRAALNTAITAWDSDPNAAKLEYGDITNWDVSAITDMSSLFANKENITTLDLSGWDTSNVTTMQYLFRSCSFLQSLNLSGWNTSQVIDMQGMFQYCHRLPSLDLSSFDTSNVQRMSSMFDRMWFITSLDLSSFDTSKVNTMFKMFGEMKRVTSINLSSFDTKLVGTRLPYDESAPPGTTGGFNGMGQMFTGCYSLTSLDLSSFDTSNVNDMHSMFSWCISLTSLNLRNFDTSKVTQFNDMFYMPDREDNNGGNGLYMGRDMEGAPIYANTGQIDNKLAAINGVEDFITSSVPPMNNAHSGYGGMFANCYHLPNYDLSSWCVPNVDPHQMGPETNFAINTLFADTASNLPNWGASCNGFIGRQTEEFLTPQP